MKAGAKVIYVNSQNKITKKYFLKNIDGVVVCLSLAVNMMMFGIINEDNFFLYLQNEMLCIKHIIVFSVGSSFHIVLSGEV